MAGGSMMAKHGNGAANVLDEKKSSMPNKYHKSNRTDSSTSLASQSKMEASCSAMVAKRTSVVFEEPRAPTITTMTSQSSSSTAPTTGNLSRAAMATSKQVNGILRKGSVPGDDIVPSATATTMPQPPTQLKLNLSPSGPVQLQQKQPLSKNNNNLERETPGESQERHHSSRKTRKSKEKQSSNKSGKSRSSKLDSLPESGLEDGESTLPRSSRSRSSSSKSSTKADKSAKDLALTRDLPCCGCWGNGCL